MGCSSSQYPVGSEGSSGTSSKHLAGDPASILTSRRTPKESQFLNKEVAAEWRANHTVSIRSNLIQTKTTEIEDVYDFNLSQELGRGGVGFVVVGQHKVNQDLYAIKICDKSSSSQARLSREVLLLKDVDHVNIIRLFSVYDAPEFMYFVMELCTGGHLGNVLKHREGGRFPEREAKTYCRLLMSAISHLHSRGIAHRDIKLQNILFDTHDSGSDPQIKLIDFGYGSRFIGALPMHSRVGTPYTIAPEVIRESYDQRCDVWSAAVVVFIMLSGKRPFEALDCVGAVTEAGKAALTTNILAGRYSFNGPVWQHVSLEAKQFLMSLFTQPYTERMEASETLVDPWLKADSRKLSVSLSSNSISNNIVANIMSNLDVSTPSLRRTGNVALAFGLQPEEASKMRQVFQTVDTDGSGGLDELEFETAMRILCPTLSSDDCRLIFIGIDVNGDKQISYTEFLAASLDPRTVDIEELNKAFHTLDANGDGYISSQELDDLYKLKLQGAQSAFAQPGQSSKTTNTARSHAPASVPIPVPVPVPVPVPAPAPIDACDKDIADMTTEEKQALDISVDILEMMASCDIDKDGRISYEEFIWGMTGRWAKEIIGDKVLDKDLARFGRASSVGSGCGGSGSLRGAGSPSNIASNNHSLVSRVLSQGGEFDVSENANAVSVNVGHARRAEGAEGGKGSTEQQQQQQLQTKKKKKQHGRDGHSSHLRPIFVEHNSDEGGEVKSDDVMPTDEKDENGASALATDVSSSGRKFSRTAQAISDAEPTRSSDALDVSTNNC